MKHNIRLNSKTTFFYLMVFALIAFEIFNFSSTLYSLEDFIGQLSIFGIKWSVLLSLAFCGADFAGMARVFTPETGKQEPIEVWLLFAAWILAASLNAVLTWWGISVAMLAHGVPGNEIVSRRALLTAVPVCLAALVWFIRFCIVGTLTLAGDKMTAVQRKMTRLNPDGIPVPAIK